MVQEWHSRILGPLHWHVVAVPGDRFRAQVTTATVYGNVTDGFGRSDPRRPGRHRQ